MQFDEKAIRRLMMLSDRQLEDLIRTIGEENGIDLSAFRITKTDAASIRKALASFTESDLARANAELNAYKNGRKPSSDQRRK